MVIIWLDQKTHESLFKQLVIYTECYCYKYFITSFISDIYISIVVKII
jgi:hypothetical protein